MPGPTWFWVRVCSAGPAGAVPCCPTLSPSVPRCLLLSPAVSGPVTTASCLKALGIRDATAVVHYDFPASPSVFGQRLFCMADNFRERWQQVGGA